MKYKMIRGVTQSLFKYLPECWIDFSSRGEGRINYTAQVLRWNSERLDGINKQRLIRAVNQAVQSFSGQPYLSGQSDFQTAIGYGTGLTIDNCQILIPKHDGEERGIIAEISPLTFYCQKCHQVYQFRSSDEYHRNHKCKTCHIGLKQVRLIYYCKCGWATAKHPVYCPSCKSSSNIIWSGALNDYKFQCGNCKRKIQMLKKCEQCGNICKPNIALNSSQYFAYNLSLVDIIDEKIEKFISCTEYGSLLTIAYWLGMIKSSELQKVIDKGISTDPEVYQNKYDEAYSLFINAGLDKKDADNAAKVSADNECGGRYIPIIKKLRSQINSSEDSLNLIAEMILEYKLVCEIEESSSLDDAINVAKFLNTNAHPEQFKKIAKSKAILHTQVCGNIPFVTCSYGYTREKFEPDMGVQLHAFKEEQNGVKNVYATKLNTEGVIFEFDRKMIIKWLISNKYIDTANAPDLEDDDAIKLWFINNVRPELIKPFSKLDPFNYPETFYIYNLIHTLSHILIRSAASLCGLEKNSLSEYILPNIPAVLIYCQNSQGFNLGALFNLFEAYFDKWLSIAYSSAQKCIFDPICLERYKACTGCLYLNEISCKHFNHDLDRSLVVGMVDRVNKMQYNGFWEIDKWL